MKIWFDLSNSPHVNLFASMIKELQKDNEVIITCRPLANTIELLDLHGFEYHVIGKHYGKKFSNKLFGFPVRVNQLYKFLKKIKPDIAIGQSSFHLPITASILGVKSIYMNDNEHAMGNIPSFIFAKIIMIPEFLDRRKVHKQMAKDSKIVQYPGVKEGIYLWNANIEKVDISKVPLSEKVVYIRPEPWIAQYYKGALNFMDDMILELQHKVKIILLPRGNEQAAHYRGEQFSKVTIPEKPLSLTEISKNCCLFIGAGGTMTREMAVLGIPTISVYQDSLLEVDEYLIKIGLMQHKPDLNFNYVINYINSCEQQPPSDELLVKGKEAYNLIKSTLLN